MRFVLLCPIFHHLVAILACNFAPNHYFGEILGFILTFRKRASVVCQCDILCFLFVSSVIGADAGNGIRVFIPDIGMFVAGLAIWLLCRSLVQKRPPEDMAQYNTDFEAEEQVGVICITCYFLCLVPYVFYINRSEWLTCFYAPILLRL